MKIKGKHFRTIWVAEDGHSIQIIDQTKLPHHFKTVSLTSTDDAVNAISDMLVRGAPLIGATAAYGYALAAHANPSNKNLEAAYDSLLASRPTAVNLRWALDKVRAHVIALPETDRVVAAYAIAAEICDEDSAMCEAMGDHALPLIEAIAKSKADEGLADTTVNILTHCNAGWLATVDWGTAIAPIYKAHEAGIKVHVWVDETRPRNQGASLTSWELLNHGVPHTLIVDNAGGHLMQQGMVDICFVGTDRTTGSGDVCNKIGTYLKALAAYDNDVPFYVCAPSPSIDWAMEDGLTQMPIEERDSQEITQITGITSIGTIETVTIAPAGTPARNDAFDVTPREYITGLVTERGIAEANRDSLEALFPEHKQQD
ncbi:MAG: S-methyl-5-thioribose-1-phosphate isomerase [Kordiimonadaceae bacterium]|nr:S-methyl-5-thioribose-1-phosphate isomerase [Kordiimonadaceae bacterium]